MNLWTVYRHPKDFPDKFVARRFHFDQPTGDVFTADTLDAIRAALPFGLYRLERSPEDEPQIVETWL